MVSAKGKEKVIQSKEFMIFDGGWFAIVDQVVKVDFIDKTTQEEIKEFYWSIWGRKSFASQSSSHCQAVDRST